MRHDHKEVSFLNAKLFDGVIVGDGLALVYDLQGIGGHALGLLDPVLEHGDLRHTAITESAASTSTWNTSPFRFFIESFI